MRCVSYNDKMPDGFEESFEYSRLMPYTVQIKRFNAEDNVPLHYAKTLEVMICDNLRGYVVIGNNRYELTGQQVFVIPPYTVHANSIHVCNGTQYVFKVSFPQIEHYLHISNILQSTGQRLELLAYECPEYDDVKRLIDRLIEKDGDLCACLSVVLQLFGIFSQYTDRNRRADKEASGLNETSLQKLITWTQQNYSSRITLDNVSRMMGYSKFYFCSRFKALTGITYLSFLNSVRISNACLRLQDGQPVQKVSADCGFENVSYFIQVFKKVQHITPYQYATRYRVSETGF